MAARPRRRGEDRGHGACRGGRPSRTGALHLTAARFDVRGIVQGVGFRPFVAHVAGRHGLAGWVRNEGGRVLVHVEGPDEAVDAFARDLRRDAPPLAHIASVTRTDVPPGAPPGFRIVASADTPGGRQAVPADVVPCDACLRELRTPGDRRHRYPFITCTDCGPRYSVVTGMPYDRERTTLAAFPLCPDCSAEYADPDGRRFHAESIACPACGPMVWLEDRDGDGWHRRAERDAAIVEAGMRLAAGQVVAVRGIGGFHLACDATDAAAVGRLRDRKRRDAKPFAVMVASLDDAERLAALTPAERALLSSRERPVVLVMPRGAAAGESAVPSEDPPTGPSAGSPPIANEVAPGLTRLGLMLANSPLHLLLLEAAGRPLVMTSGNLSDEPIAAGLGEGRARLAALADALLLHDREIAARVDDSVVRAAGATPILLRRARGFAPLPLALPMDAPVPVLAVGAHLKHTLAFAAGRDAYVSPHIGDLDTLEVLAHAERVRDGLAQLLRLEPGLIAQDLHAWYLSPRLGDPWPDLPRVGVQHHHAHIAAVMAEHGVTDPVLGIAYDGTGAGDDGTSWGAEFLRCDLGTSRRIGHWRAVRLPGGDRASREGWRAAVGYAMSAAEADWDRALAGVPAEAVAQARRQAAAGVNAPVATSMGRLFDAVAALAGVRAVSRYEGQAAMELEGLADLGTALGATAEFGLGDDGAEAPLVVDPLPLLARIVAQRLSPAEASAGLHATLIRGTEAAAVRLCERHGLDTVALGGGTWQNAVLLEGVRTALEGRGLRVLTAVALPPNDGGIAFGQAVVAIARRASGNA